MKISEFLSEYDLEGKLLDYVDYDESYVELVIDLCFWMNPDYKKDEENPEDDLIAIRFDDIENFSWPIYEIEECIIEKMSYDDGWFTITLYDDVEEETYEMKFFSKSGKILF